MKIKPALFAIV